MAKDREAYHQVPAIESSDCFHPEAGSLSFLARIGKKSLLLLDGGSAQRQISCELGDPFEVPEQTPLVWYLALRAADIFKTQNGRYPGEEDAQVETAPGDSTKKCYSRPSSLI